MAVQVQLLGHSFFHLKGSGEHAGECIFSLQPAAFFPPGGVTHRNSPGKIPVKIDPVQIFYGKNGRSRAIRQIAYPIPI